MDPREKTEPTSGWRWTEGGGEICDQLRTLRHRAGGVLVPTCETSRQSPLENSQRSSIMPLPPEPPNMSLPNHTQTEVAQAHAPGNRAAGARSQQQAAAAGHSHAVTHVPLLI